MYKPFANFLGDPSSPPSHIAFLLRRERSSDFRPSTSSSGYDWLACWCHQKIRHFPGCFDPCTLGERLWGIRSTKRSAPGGWCTRRNHYLSQMRWKSHRQTQWPGCRGRDFKSVCLSCSFFVGCLFDVQGIPINPKMVKAHPEEGHKNLHIPDIS